MWRGVEAGLGVGDGESEGVVDGEMQGAVGVGQVTGVDRVVAGQAVGAMGYNEAPRAPREEMWGRIEAAWGMRGGGGVANGGLGLRRRPDGVAGLPAEPLRAPWRWPSRRWPRRQRVAGWAVGARRGRVLSCWAWRLAGVRGKRSRVRWGPIPSSRRFPLQRLTRRWRARRAPQPVQPAEPEPPVHTASIVPLPGAPVDQQAPAIQAELEPQTVGFAEATLTEVTEQARPLPSSLVFRRDREQLRFFGRAETLLTALRTDQRTPLTERDLAAWGRELLIETRMHLDLQELQVPTEFALLEDRKLLEDLELVMLQISRLGSGATDVEWQLARESIEIKNALPRLRAATDADGL